MQISETCIRRPVMTTLITASLIVFGVFAYRLLAVAALPAVDFPTIQITATLPGASPETMAASVAGPIERQLSTIAGITSMTSTSALGTTSIIIQFELTREIDGAALDVQTALTVAQRRLPIEMTTPPSFRKVNPGDFPILYISLVSPTLPLSTVDDYGEITLAQQISQLPGVAQVLVYGAQKFAVRVQVDPVAAASRGVSLDDVRNVVTKANSNTPVGTIAGVRQNTTITASAAMNHAADYRDVVVAYRAVKARSGARFGRAGGGGSPTSSHSGTTAMELRKDALVGAAELVLCVQRVALEKRCHVATVGQLIVNPNATNIIPGEVDCTIEVRDLEREKILATLKHIRECGQEIAFRSNIKIEFSDRKLIESVPCSPLVREAIARSCVDLGFKFQTLPSGAGHDAQMMAKLAPTGMIFVPSTGGISHSPREFTSSEDCARGAQVLLETILRLDDTLPGLAGSE